MTGTTYSPVWIAAKKSASAQQQERIAARLEEVLAQSGYVHARTEDSTRMKIRRLIYRMQLNAHDAEVWLGMLRQIMWKLGSDKSEGGV